MPSVPLSNHSITTVARNLKALAKELRGGASVNGVSTRIEQSIGELVAGEVRSNIAGIADVDGNYLGGDPSAVTIEPSIKGHEVVWRGQQIAYLEFGTGAPGAEGGYGGMAMAEAGYRPDPLKTEWAYKDAELGPTVSHGLAPQAPMLNASMVLRSSALTKPAVAVVKEALARALTV